MVLASTGEYLLVCLSVVLPSGVGAILGDGAQDREESHHDLQAWGGLGVPLLVPSALIYAYPGSRAVSQRDVKSCLYLRPHYPPTSHVRHLHRSRRATSLRSNSSPASLTWRVSVRPGKSCVSRPSPARVLPRNRIAQHGPAEAGVGQPSLSVFLSLLNFCCRRRIAGVLKEMVVRCSWWHPWGPAQCLPHGRHTPVCVG